MWALSLSLLSMAAMHVSKNGGFKTVLDEFPSSIPLSPLRLYKLLTDINKSLHKHIQYKSYRNDQQDATV